MIINQGNLGILYTGFRTTFNGTFTGTPTQYGRVAMTVPSTTGKEQHGWLGMIPRIREWIGDRTIQSLDTHDFTIKNRDFELTISVPRNTIQDDSYGLFTPMFSEMGRATAVFPDELIWPLLTSGFGQLCYDGQYFFDTDHPVLDEKGQPTTVSNSGGGSGTPWFLLDTSRMVKPLLWQTRQPFNFVRLDRADDENVVMRKEYIYGVDARCNAGYGLWQLAYGSKQTLNAANYAAARAAMMGMKGDYGRPLGLNPNLLVFPPSLEGAARTLLLNEFDGAGASNPWKGTAEPLNVVWLA